jgi:hypothetical protein
VALAGRVGAAAIESVKDLGRQLWVLERMIGQPVSVRGTPRDRALESDQQPELALVTVG